MYTIDGDARRARIERVDRAQQWVSILVGAIVLFVVGWMTLESMSPHPIKKDAEAGAAAFVQSSAGVAATTSSPAAGANDASAVTASLSDDLDAGLFMPALSMGDAATSSLGSGAPRHVKLGVVLVMYQGAEGAPSNARSKQDALAIAQRLLDEAKADFHHAVTSGDSGSSDNIGSIPRGVLEPKTEAAVFALSMNEISDVLETTHGYWIAKRIE